MSQSVQPEAIFLHVETPLPWHCLAPSLHWLTHLVTHLPPEQISPPLHGAGAAQSVQPEAIFLHVETPLP